tara:strand:- start:1586 stop:1690 length:105 start_codon:yes stop_codon:yes gene_type:complete
MLSDVEAIIQQKDETHNEGREDTGEMDVGIELEK